jgi:hypothetical protein
MNMVILVSLLLLFIRLVECYIFIKKVNKVCGEYDWKHVDANAELLLEILEKDYFLTNKWSAYNFLYLKGPNLLSIFFSFKPITIEAQYDNKAVEKLKIYEII